MLRWIVDVAFRLWDTAVTIVYYAIALVGALILSVVLLEFSFRNNPLPEEKLTLELYPYDGFHNRADHVVTGDMANEQQPYHDYEWRFGGLEIGRAHV